MSRYGLMALALALALVLLPGAGLANDSMVSIGVGGLVLEKTEAVRMASEDLRIGRDLVTVDYVFENLTDAAVTAEIGFPLPKYQLDDYDFEAQSIDLAAPLAPFRTLIDGVAEPSQVHMQVSTSDGRDITAILEEAGLLPTSYADLPDEAAITPHADRIDAAGERLGISDLSGSWGHWRYGLTYLWTMEIEPGATIEVHHEYAPLLGGFPFHPLAPIEGGETYRDILTEAYCPLDGQWDAIVDAANANADGFAGYVMEVSYVLTSGANWAGPIGNFRLTLDGGDEALPMMCGLGEAAEVSATKRVFTEGDFVPGEDLVIGFFEPAAP